MHALVASQLAPTRGFLLLETFAIVSKLLKKCEQIP